MKSLSNGWHVLYVKNRHEQKIEQNLNDRNFEVYLPLVKTIRIWSDRKKKVYEPLFKNYLFVKLNSLKDFYEALKIPGVIKYLKCGPYYSRIDESDIRQIKQMLSLEDVQCNGNYIPAAGEKMRITYGPLNGLNCTVIRSNTKNKIYVRIDSINQSIMAYVPSLYIEPMITANHKMASQVH